MVSYVDEHFKQVLKTNKLETFEQLWNYQGELVEEGNKKFTDGRSDVTRLRLVHDGVTTIAYMKRQLNYITHASRLIGSPRSVCAREFDTIQAWHAIDLPTMTVLYFSQVLDPVRAILITQDLTGFIPLDEWLLRASAEQRKQALHECAQLLKRIHSKGWLHHCFFAKHVFIKDDEGVLTFRMIDLEKAKKRLITPGQWVDELTAFMRRMTWTEEEAEAFLLSYFNVKRLNAWRRFLYSRIQKRVAWKAARAMQVKS